MASNLKAAAEALRQKQPKKKFRVTFKTEETFYVDVDAVDSEAASEEANEIFNNGGAHENGYSQSEEVDCS
mgnify:CR=1 FL=1